MAISVRQSNRASQGTANSADIVAVIGASSMGKSSYIKRELLRKYSRLMVWSPLEETDQYADFCGGVVVDKITDLVAEVKGKAKAIVYVPTGNDAAIKKQFDFFCRIAWELKGGKILVEELSGVTMPSWAPPAWKKLSTAGRHKGLSLIGVSQRPADIDKSFLGNCTEIRCYRVNYDNDAKVMADTLLLRTEGGVSGPDRIRLLPQFHYFHKNPDLSVTQGVNKAL